MRKRADRKMRRFGLEMPRFVQMRFDPYAKPPPVQIKNGIKIFWFYGAIQS